MKGWKLGLGLLGLASAAAAVPPGVKISKFADHITLYERSAAVQTVPSFWELFFQLFRVPPGTRANFPFGRSVSVLVGVGNYKYLTPKLEYVSKDVERMRDYLLTDGGFDAIYVMDEGTDPQAVDTFMTDELPKRLGMEDRLLFYYSGHGADPGGGHPVLQFQKAQPNQWSQTVVLRVDQFEIWSAVIKAKHVLFIYDACMAGEAVAKESRDDARDTISELSANGSRIVVTAGTAEQKAWVMKVSAENQYSIFTAALLSALRDGTSDLRNRGFVTIDQAVAEAGIKLAFTTRRLGPGHEMKPVPVSVDPTRKGTFVFLNSKATGPAISQTDLLAMGLTVAKGGDENKLHFLVKIVRIPGAPELAGLLRQDGYDVNVISDKDDSAGKVAKERYCVISVGREVPPAVAGRAISLVHTRMPWVKYVFNEYDRRYTQQLLLNAHDAWVKDLGLKELTEADFERLKNESQSSEEFHNFIATFKQ